MSLPGPGCAPAADGGTRRPARIFEEACHGVAITLHQYLANRGIDYEVLKHHHTGSASRSAQASHVPGERVAKAVVLKDEEGYLLAVLPATHHIQLGRLRGWLGRSLGLATENEAGDLFRDCALGAVPALGDAYGLEVVVDDSLSGQHDVYFEGGDHASLVQVTAQQFRDLLGRARHGRFCRHD